MHTQPDFNLLRPVACGDSEADLLFVNGRVINVFTGEILEAAVSVKGQYIAGVGDYSLGHEIIDLQGSFLLPGLIDSHIHIESSMLTPAAFARTAIPHGTTAVLADPHEIVNVLGLAGWRYMVDSSQDLPMDFFWQIPSCVPATHMETSGGIMGLTEVKLALDIFPQSPALAEMMNYPGVINGQESVLSLIKQARRMNLLIEGHSPGLQGYALNSYAAAGCSSDHECTSQEEALEKLRLGFRLLIREGSAARNLLDLLPIINLHNYHRCSFCSDDRHPAHLLQEGHMDHILRKAAATGFPAIQAIQMATLHPALHYHLNERGAIAPGYLADLVIVDNLRDFGVQQVYKQGRLVADRGKCVADLPTLSNDVISQSVIIPNVEGQLQLTPPPEAQRVKVIEIIPGQILTKCLDMSLQAAFNDPAISKLAVVERHGCNGNIAMGLVKGFDLQRGAMASSVAHDSHNLIIVGQDERSMEIAALKVAEMGGGMAVVDGDQVIASLALPVAGLMSPCPAAEVASQHEALEMAAHHLGCHRPAPFMTLSFLSLPVIPELRLTDQGLVDVNQFKLVDIWMA